jgi:hypothetical protein
MSQQSELRHKCQVESSNNDTKQAQPLVEQVDTQMIKLVDLFNDSDKQQLDTKLFIYAKTDNGMFIIENHRWNRGFNESTMVPASARLMRDEQNQLVGTPIVKGG